jgi:hypothetical protein
MGTREILFIISLSISFPAITCLIIYKRIDRHRFPIYPIFICLILGLIIELGSFIKGENVVFPIFLNIYLLFEFILLQVQFYFWSKFLHTNFPLKSIIGIVIFWFIAVFILEIHIKKTFHLLLYIHLLWW